MRFTFALCLILAASNIPLLAADLEFPELAAPAMPEISRPKRTLVRPKQESKRIGKKMLIVNPAAKSPATEAIEAKETAAPALKPTEIQTKATPPNSRPEARPRRVYEPAFSRTPSTVPPAPRTVNPNKTDGRSAPLMLPPPPQKQHWRKNAEGDGAVAPLLQDISPPVGSSVELESTLDPTLVSEKQFNSILNSTPRSAPLAPPDTLITELRVNPRETVVDADEPDENRIQFESDVPQLRVTTIGPNTLIVGKLSRYAITLNNKSNFDAYDVQVRCSIPEWVHLDEHQTSTGSVSTQAQDMTWAVDHVPARGSQELTLELTPTAAREFELNVDIAVQPSQARKRISIQEPKLVLDLVGPESVVYNETDLWQITVENPGTGDAEDVVLEVFAGESKLESQHIGKVAAGEKRTATLDVTALGTGRHRLRLIALGALGLKDEATSKFLCRRGRLSVDLIGADLEYAGSSSEYEVVVSNTGDADAQNVLISLELPPGVVYEGGIASPNHTAGGVSWIVDRVAFDDTQTFPIVLRHIDGGSHEIRATVNTTDDLSDETSMVTESLVSADLRLFVTDPIGPQGMGRITEYKIDVVNQGSDTAREIEIIAVCAPEIEPVDVDGNALIKRGQIFFKPLADLPPDHKVSYAVRVQATKPGTHTFRVVVKSYQPKLRLATEESTLFFDRKRQDSK